MCKTMVPVISKIHVKKFECTFSCVVFLYSRVCACHVHITVLISIQYPYESFLFNRNFLNAQ